MPDIAKIIVNISNITNVSLSRGIADSNHSIIILSPGIIVKVLNGLITLSILKTFKLIDVYINIVDHPIITIAKSRIFQIYLK